MSGVLEGYLELMRDPAHLLVELTFVAVVDGVLGALVWPVLRRRLHREHLAIDAEHGVTHSEKVLEKGVQSHVRVIP